MRMEDVAIVFRYQVLSPLHSYLYDGFWQKIWELISAAQSYQFPNLCFWSQNLRRCLLTLALERQDGYFRQIYACGGTPGSGGHKVSPISLGTLV